MWCAHHTVSLEDADEMAEALGRLWAVARTVPSEPGDIAVYHGGVPRADGNAVSVQPSGTLLTGTQGALEMTRCIPFVGEEGGEVVQVWPHGTTAQSGHHGRPDKDMFAPGLLLFPEVDWKRRRIARLDHAK